MNFPDPLKQIFYLREFQRLAMAGAALPLTCGRDGGILYTAVGKDDQFYLFCLECEYKLFPGSDLIDKVVAVVNEHNIINDRHIDE